MQLHWDYPQIEQGAVFHLSSITDTLVKLRRQFQEKLDGLKSISFMVEDAKMLQDAIGIADSLQVALCSTCTRVGGILLRGSPEKKKLKITLTDYHKVFHKKFPQKVPQKKTKEDCFDNEYQHK